MTGQALGHNRLRKDGRTHGGRADTHAHVWGVLGPAGHRGRRQVPALPPLRYGRSEPVGCFPPKSRQEPEPLLSDCRARFFQCYSFGPLETSAKILRNPVQRQATHHTAPARPWRSKPHPTHHLPRQSLRSLCASPASVPLSPSWRCHQYSDHSTALLPLSTLTTWEPEGDHATALMDELCCLERTFSTFPESTLQT